MTTTSNLSDNCGYLKLAQHFGVPYHIPLLLADRADALCSGKPTTTDQQNAWREANQIMNRNSLDRLLRGINWLRERFVKIRTGEIDYASTNTHHLNSVIG
jgi:hypothetical protein